MQEIWEKDFDETFIKKLSNTTYSGFILDCDPKFVKAFIRTQRTAAQVELLQTILREDFQVKKGKSGITYELHELARAYFRVPLEARLAALTANN